MSKRILKLNNDLARQAACRYINDAPEGYVITIAEPTRSLDANALLWVLLECLAKQTDWHGNKLNSEEWKDLMSAGLVQSKVVPNLTGNGFVILGQRTSKLSKSNFAALLEMIYAFGTERGVDFEQRNQQRRIEQGVSVDGEFERMAA